MCRVEASWTQFIHFGMFIAVLLVQLAWLLYNDGNGEGRAGLDLVPYILWDFLWHPKRKHLCFLISLPRCESEKDERDTGLESFLQLISKVDLEPLL